jgi:hypothetical protein
LRAVKERIVWTLFSAALLGVAGFAAQALAAAAWRRMTGREPPDEVWGIAPVGRRAGAGLINQAARYLPMTRH